MIECREHIHGNYHNYNDIRLNQDGAFFVSSFNYLYYLTASEPKSVNPVLDIIGVNSLRLEGGLHLSL